MNVAQNIPGKVTGPLVNWYFYGFTILLLVQVVGVASGLVPLNPIMNLVYIAFNAVCIIMDRRAVQSAGYTAPSTWWVLFIPVYVWKRCTVTSTHRGIFWVYILMLIGSTGTVLSVGMKDDLETAICNTATSIEAQNMEGEVLSCAKVLTKEHLFKGHYKGQLLMSDMEAYDYKADVADGYVKVTLY